MVFINLLSDGVSHDLFKEKLQLGHELKENIIIITSVGIVGYGEDVSCAIFHVVRCLRVSSMPPHLWYI